MLYQIKFEKHLLKCYSSLEINKQIKHTVSLGNFYLGNNNVLLKKGITDLISGSVTSKSKLLTKSRMAFLYFS